VRALPAANDLFARRPRLGYDLLSSHERTREKAQAATDEPAAISFPASRRWSSSSDRAGTRAVRVSDRGLESRELPALAFAGRVFEDGVKLVQARGRAMQAAARRPRPA